MNADLATAIETAKFCSRDVMGVIRVLPSQDELLKMLLKHMILEILGDPACYIELTDEEKTELEDVLLIYS
jgi:hypothetical protein